MRKLIAALCFVIGCSAGLSAQNLQPVGSDLSSLLSGFGESILPYVQQTILADDGVGAASLGGSHFYVGVTMGATFTSGLLGFVDEPNRFQVLDVNGLVSSLLPSSMSSYYSTLKTFFLEPDAKLVLGFSPGFGVEVLGTFSMLPQFLTSWGTGLAQSSFGVSGLGSLQLNALSASLRARKVLMEDSGPFPAISLGVGYAYQSFMVGYPLPSFTQSYGSYTLTLGGTLSLQTAVQMTGVDLAISKKLLIFVPFVHVMPWYEWATYTSGFGSDFVAKLTDASNTTVASLSTAPSATVTTNDLSLLVSGGVEIRLGGFALVPSGSYDLATQTLGANLSMRGQF